MLCSLDQTLAIFGMEQFVKVENGLQGAGWMVRWGQGGFPGRHALMSGHFAVCQIKDSAEQFRTISLSRAQPAFCPAQQSDHPALQGLPPRYARHQHAPGVLAAKWSPKLAVCAERQDVRHDW